MQPTHPGPEIESLLAHAAWVRRLARSLVADPRAAEDASQDTILAALRRPPDRASSAASWRSWLARVLRNRVREMQRRERRLRAREALAARPELVNSSAEIVERTEVLHAVVKAVLDLPEPLRSAVLMRYVDDLSVAEISSRTNASEDAVRKRISRGIAELRARFDDRGARRGARAWLGILALAHGGTSVPPISGVSFAGAILMSKIFAATAAVLLVGIAYLLRSGAATLESVSRVEPDDRTTLGVETADAGTRSAAEALDTFAPSSFRHPAPTVASTGDSAAMRTGSESPPDASGSGRLVVVRGRCVAAEDGATLAGCRAVVKAWKPRAEGAPSIPLEIAEQRTDTAGGFELRFHITDGTNLDGLHIAIPGRCSSYAELAPTRELEQILELGTIALLRAWRVHGRILDEQGRSREGIVLQVNDVPWGAVGPSGARRNATLVAMSDAEGRFAFKQEIPAGAFRWTIPEPAHASLHSPTMLEVREGETDVERRVIVGFRPSVSGTLFSAGSMPLQRFHLMGKSPQREYEARTWRSSGRFQFVGDEGDPGPLEIRVVPGEFEAYVHDHAVPWGTEDLRLEVQRAGTLDLEVVIAGSATPVESYAVICHSAQCTHQPWTQPRFEGVHSGGKLRIDAVPAGECVLRVQPEEPRFLEPSQLRFTKIAGVTPALRLEVERAAMLVVEVVSPSGEPIGASDAIEVIRPYEDEPIGAATRLLHRREAERGERGPVLLQQLICDSKSRATIRLEREERGCALRVRGYRHPTFVVRDIDVLFDSPLRRVTAPLGGAIEGIVVPAELRRLPLRICAGRSDRLVFNPEPTDQPAFAQVSVDGRFALDGLAPGAWNLYATWEGAGKDRPVATIDVAAGERRSVELSIEHLLPARIDGVLVPRTGEALGIRIDAFSCSEESRSLVTRALVERDGRFRLADLPPGRVELLAYPPTGKRGFGLRSDPIDVRPGERVEHEWNLAWRSIRFRAMAAEPRAPLLRELLYLGSAKSMDGLELETDSEGRVSIDMAPMGVLVVQRRNDEAHRARIPADIAEDLGDLVLQKRR
ncbi:MAG: sigma-70 family RNA polymerase sigma factor [Planctomycetes bacterium]|nr:sigma-70 family RNA polymerase sigma factor [Planctomycetota bacterium]